MFTSSECCPIAEKTLVQAEHDDQHRRRLVCAAESRAARHTAFVVAGKEKRAIFDGLHRGDASLPAARLHPIAGDGIPLRPSLVHTQSRARYP